MNKQVVISNEILNLVIAMKEFGHRIAVSHNEKASGNSHTTVDIKVIVRTPNEAGAVAFIDYRATDSYNLGYAFKRMGVTPAFTSKVIRMDDYVNEISVRDVVADANAIRDAHMKLKGMPYIERALKAVTDSHLTESFVS